MKNKSKIPVVQSNTPSKKISKIFQTSSIFDILPVNKWWEDKKNLEINKDDDDASENDDNDESDNNSENSKNEKMYLGNKNEVKFSSLEHNGVIFPQAYQTHGVRIKYKNEPIALASHCEELATFWAATLDSDFSQKEIAQKNFFKEFKTQLRQSSEENKTKFENSKFEDFDFSPIYEYILNQRHCENIYLIHDRIHQYSKVALHF